MYFCSITNEMSATRPGTGTCGWDFRRSGEGENVLSPTSPGLTTSGPPGWTWTPTSMIFTSRRDPSTPSEMWSFTMLKGKISHLNFTSNCFHFYISCFFYLFSLKSEAYEKSLGYSLSKANVLINSEMSPCDEKFWPVMSQDSPGNILFISMTHSKDFTSWLALAKCLRVWDLDARGYHRGLWRLHYNQSPLFIVGAPFSPYS